MGTYRIEVETNGYIAARDTMFQRGKTVAVLEEGLTLKEARIALLDLYNRYHDTNYSNWGTAVIRDRHRYDGARKTFYNATRCFSWDSRTFKIEEENEDN